MFPEFEKYSLYPKSKGTITSSNTLPMEKQTAVEWLINELVELDKLLDDRRKNEDDTVFKLPPDKLYERAKQIEKKQINKAYYQGIYDKNEGLIKEEYYKEIFNKK